MKRESNLDRYTLSDGVRNLNDADAILAPAEVIHRNIPVDVDSDRHNGQVKVHVSIADVENPIGVGIMGASWSDFGARHFQKNRLGAVAKFTGLRMIGIDFPGMGDHLNGRKNEFIPADYVDMKKGRLIGIAKRSWRALEQEDLLTDGRRNLPIALLGHSLSTLTIAEMAATLPEGHQITDLNLSEKMALRVRTRRALMQSFMGDSAVDLAYYSEMNAGAPKEDKQIWKRLERQVVRQPRAHYHSFAALRLGQHGKPVNEAILTGRLNLDREHGTRYHTIAAEHGISFAPDARQFHDRLIAKGMPESLAMYTQLDGEYHGWQDSFPALLHQMSRLAIVEAAQ